MKRQPLERDILWRPERLKYVRKLVKSKGCPFCTAHKKGVSAQSLLLHKARHTMVILNKYPYNTGHLLVLPKRHCGDLFDLSRDEYTEMMDLVRFCVKIMKKSYDCHGFNLGLNLGGAGGAGIPDHLHHHIVPRWRGDTNFLPLIAETKVLPETLEQSFDRLLPYFEEVHLNRGKGRS